MLNANCSVPLYQQLKEKLREEIASGVYKSGEQLPSERAFSQKNGISLITVRKALAELAAEGIIDKKQGKGSFVAIPKYGRDYTSIMSFSEACRMEGLRPGSSLIVRRIERVDENIARILRLEGDQLAVYISRLRTVNEEPMVIENSYFSLEYSFLLKEDLSGSLFDLLRSRLQVEITSSRKTIEICRAQSDDAKLLNVTRNSPLMLVKSIAFMQNDQPAYYCTQIINGERYKLHV